MNELMILMGMGESGKTTYAKKIAKEKGYEYIRFDSLGSEVSGPYGSKENFYRALTLVIGKLCMNPDKNFVLDGYVYASEGEYLDTNFEYLKKGLKFHKIKPVVVFTDAETISERVIKRGSPDTVDRDFVVNVYKDIAKHWDLSNADFIESYVENNKVKNYGDVMKIVEGLTRQDVINFMKKPELLYPNNYQSIELPFGYKFCGYNADYEYGSWDRIKNIIDYKNKKVADIGSSFGFFCFKIKEEGASFVNGYDISKVAVKVSKEVADLKGSDVNFEVLDIDKQEIPGDYDIVLLLNTIHHLKNTKSVLEQVFSKSKNVIMEVQFDGFSRKIQKGWKTMQENTKDWNKEKIIEIAKKYNHKLKKELDSDRPHRIIMLFSKEN